MTPLQTLLAAMRTSEFWVVAFQAFVAVTSMPVPDEYKATGWLYVLFRVVSKLAQFVFPNQSNPRGGWLRSD
jgi:hypothetical protein